MPDKTERKINSIDDLLVLLEGVERKGSSHYKALCPGHDDHEPSLSITEIDGKIFIFCHAGCTPDAVLAPLGLTLANLFLDDGHIPEAIYQYRNQDGSLAYEKLKYRQSSGKKTFLPRRLSGGKLVGNLEGIQRVPYNYPAVIAAIKNGETISLAEGERDAETARILGYVGTTMGGASDWKDEWQGFFRNARIVITADNDPPGIGLVQKISLSLCKVCKSVRVVILPEGGDLTEWVSLGHARADLDKLIAEAPELVKPKGGFNWRDFAITHDVLLDKELAPLDYLVEDLLTIPGTAILAGKKKSGKSWMVLQLAQSIASGAPFLGKATQQGEVIYLALEDGERRLKQRLEMQGTIRGLPITYITDLPPLNEREGMDALKEITKSKHARLMVIDTFAKAKNKLIDENEAGAIGDLLNQLHSIAIAEDMVIIMVAHHGKASYNDPGFDIRGSSAIPGATDTNLGLYKNSDSTFDLRAEGRDIGEIDLRIYLDKEQTWAWQCRGDARDILREEADDALLNAIELLGGEADTKTIAKELGISRTATSLRLQRLKLDGVVGYKTDGGKVLYSYPLTPLTGLTTTNSLTGLTPLTTITGEEAEETIKEGEKEGGLLRVVKGETPIAKIARGVKVVNPPCKTGTFNYEDEVDVVEFCGGPDAYDEEMKRQAKAGGAKVANKKRGKVDGEN